PANYSCREISCNEKAGTICIEVTIKVSENKVGIPCWQVYRKNNYSFK
ncbi:unnamed protein product, partial [marine sediment metagenome]